MTILTEPLNTLKKWLLIIVLSALAVSFVVIFFMTQTITTLKAEKAKQSEQIGALASIITTNKLTIEKLTQRNIDNQNALVALRQKDERTQAELKNQTTYFMGLLNENETLKNWANTPLPDDVISLYSRTKAINGNTNN